MFYFMLVRLTKIKKASQYSEIAKTKGNKSSLLVGVYTKIANLGLVAQFKICIPPNLIIPCCGMETPTHMHKFEQGYFPT